jgi:hypothetical protein
VGGGGVVLKGAHQQKQVDFWQIHHVTSEFELRKEFPVQGSLDKKGGRRCNLLLIKRRLISSIRGV